MNPGGGSGSDVGAGAEASLHEAPSPAMTMASDQSELVLYQTDDGITRIHVRLVEGTVWLTQRQLARRPRSLAPAPTWARAM
jgi:hypothetical protein